MTSPLRQSLNSTPSSIRTVCGIRMKLGRPTSLNMDFPGINPSLLQDEAFSTRSGETNYRYQCMSRTVHPVSASRCYNKLPVVLRLPQHLAAGSVLNFSASRTYFLDPDSRLLSPIASEVPCSTPGCVPNSSGMDRRHAGHTSGPITQAVAGAAASPNGGRVTRTRLQ